MYNKDAADFRKMGIFFDALVLRKMFLENTKGIPELIERMF